MAFLAHEGNVAMNAELLNPLPVFPTHPVSVDVVVVGAGPVGMALAYGLRRRGVDVLLLEKASRIVPAFKGEYVQPAGVEILKRIGLDPSGTASSAGQVRELRFRDLDRSDDIMSDILMSYSAQSEPAVTIAHHDLIANMRRQVIGVLGDRFWTGITIKPLGVTDRRFFNSPRLLAEHSTQGSVEIRAKYLIGCDGRGSIVRSWMKGPRVPANAAVVTGAPREWIIGAQLAASAPLPRRYEVLRSYTQGTVSAFSLGAQGQRLYFSSVEAAAESGSLLNLQVDEILSRVQPHVALGRLGPEMKLASFPAYTRWFGPSQQGHVFLAGDACGVTTPYGGQGISGGLEAVADLLEWLPTSVQNSGHWSLGFHAAETQYSFQVKKTFYRHNLIDLGIYYLFFARNPMFKSVSAHVISSWQKNPEIAQRVMNLFAGTDRNIPGPIELAEIWGLPLWPRWALPGFLPVNQIQKCNWSHA